MSRAPAFGYVRISKDDSSDPSQSPEAQRLAIRAYCAGHELDLLETYTDLSVSGSVPIGRRPAGGELCRRLDRKGARGSVVVVAKIDRAWRRASDALVTTEEWTKIGVRCHVLNLPITDLSSTEGRFMFSMLAIGAEWERGCVRDRTRSALAHRKSNGRRWNRIIPLGLRLVTGGGLVVESEDALTCYLIDRWCGELAIPSAVVARRLTGLDRPLPNASWAPAVAVPGPEERRPSVVGRAWSGSSVVCVARRLAQDPQAREQVLREAVAAKARGWIEPDSLDAETRARLV